jgi:hypothetical protein
MSQTAPPPAGPPDLVAVYSRVLTHGERLYEALADLEEAGGVPALSRSVRPASVHRLAAMLRTVRAATDRPLADARAVRGR